MTDNYYQKVNPACVCSFLKQPGTPRVSPLQVQSHRGVWEALLWNVFDYTISCCSPKIWDCDKCNVKSCSNENMARICLDWWEDYKWLSRRKRWFLTPYLHWREEAPYWKRHCSSASYTCPGATVGYRKSRFRGSLSRHVPRPELSKKQTYNRIVSYTKEALWL